MCLMGGFALLVVLAHQQVVDEVVSLVPSPDIGGRGCIPPVLSFSYSGTLRSETLASGGF